MSEDARDLAFFFVGVCIVLGCLVYLASGYSDATTECERRGGVIVIDKLYQAKCLAAPVQK